MHAHAAECEACRAELDSYRPVLDALVAWHDGLLCPSRTLWSRLADRIATDTGKDAPAPATSTWVEPSWEAVGPGINVKMLATAPDRVSMLVRLAPGFAYPAHRHGGVEELYVLDGDLDIDRHRLLPGDYRRAEPGTTDERVFSETGCTCLLITSLGDLLL